MNTVVIMGLFVTEVLLCYRSLGPLIHVRMYYWLLNIVVGDLEKGVVGSLPQHLKEHERPPLLTEPEVKVVQR